MTYNEDAIAKQLGLGDVGREGGGRRERCEGGGKRSKTVGAVEVVLTAEQAAEREAMIEEMKKRWGMEGRRAAGGRGLERVAAGGLCQATARPTSHGTVPCWGWCRVALQSSVRV